MAITASAAVILAAKSLVSGRVRLEEARIDVPLRRAKNDGPWLGGASLVKNDAHFYDRLFLAGQGGDVAGWPQRHELKFFDGGNWL